MWSRSTRCFRTAAAGVSLARFRPLFARLAQLLAELAELTSNGFAFLIIQATVAVFVKRAENAFAQGGSAWSIAFFALTLLCLCGGAWPCQQTAHDNHP